MSQLRVWCETLPLPALSEPELLRELAARDVRLLAAVRPDDLADIPRLLDAAAGVGLRVGLWPMLADADGRWASAHNVEAFCRFVDRVVERAEGCPALAEIAVDLEPPFGLVSGIVSRRPSAAPRRPPAFAPLEPARRGFSALVDRLRGQGLAVSAAVLPMVLFERGNTLGWQRLLGTPVDGVPWSHLSVMAYTSLFEGWSLRTVPRRAAVALLAECCRRAHDRFGPRAGVSLGAVGTGAFGDEPTFRTLDELREDVSVARGVGLDAVTLFDLAGALRRPPAWPWLDALEAPPRAAPSSRRAQALAVMAEAVGRAAS